MGGPSAKIGEIYAKSLDTFNLDSPKANYNPSEGQINFKKIQARHGPDALYAHIMRAAFDPAYGREMSIVQQEERPATRFPLAETTRPNERSENINLVDLLGGSFINHNKINPFQNTTTIYDTGERMGKGKEEGPYQSYGGNYRGNYRKNDEDNNATNKNPLRVKINPLYKVASVARAVEQRGKEYSRRFYDAFAKRKESGGEKQTYEASHGISAKVSYFIQKLKDYAKKVTGYNPQSAVQEQKSTYDGQEVQVQTYILPNSYAGTNRQQTNAVQEQDTLVPQDVIDATIADAEDFLRNRKRLVGGEADIADIVQAELEKAA